MRALYFNEFLAKWDLLKMITQSSRGQIDHLKKWPWEVLCIIECPSKQGFAVSYAFESPVKHKSLLVNVLIILDEVSVYRKLSFWKRAILRIAYDASLVSFEHSDFVVCWHYQRHYHTLFAVGTIVITKLTPTSRQLFFRVRASSDSNMRQNNDLPKDPSNAQCRLVTSLEIVEK